MSDKYNHQKIEKKWAEKWFKDKIFTPDLEKAKDPYYALFMFPYPSAEGLHIGNFYAFICVDVMAKYKRLQGKDVFEPIGFDAFGMHSENYALKINETPRKMLNRTIANFRKQLSSAGLGCDWTREIDTTTPEYYKWTQWIFTKLFEKGLAYQKEALLNWCPGCKTVLADEQIEEGVCERCKTVPEKKIMKQWFLKITAYAQRLLDGLDDMDWSNITKHAQKNWIGRSEGAKIVFKVKSQKSKVKILKFNKILLATNNIAKRERVKKLLKSAGLNIEVLSPENLKIKTIDTLEDGNLFENAKNKALAYRNKTDLPILGIDTGFYIKGEKIDPVKVKRNALKGEDEKDLSQEQIAKKMFDYYKEIARKNGGQVDACWSDYFVLSLPDGSIKKSESKREVFLTDQISGKIDIYTPIRCLYKPKATGKYISEQNKDDELKELYPVTKSLIQLLCADNNNEIEVFTTRPDTLFGATYMVLSPEHSLVKKITTPEQKKEIEKYIKKSGAKSDLERAEAKEKTGVFTGAYAVNPVNNEKIPVWIADYVLMGYGTGAIMAVPAHDERDFEFAKKYNLPIREVVIPIFGDKHEQEEYRETITALIYRKKDNKFLYLDDNHYKIIAPIIGGIEKGESIENAAEREVYEETGYKVKFVKKLGGQIESHFFASHKNVWRNRLDQPVLCELLDEYEESDEISKEEDNKHKVIWITAEEALKRIAHGDNKMGLLRYLGKAGAFIGEGRNVNSGFPDEVSVNVNKKKMNCIMIHGSSVRSKIDDHNYIAPNKRHWHGWIEDKLNENGYEVENPVMPQDWEPSYKEWREEIEKFKINENTILIGTSLGGTFLVKWLGETKKKVKKLILNAPSKILIKGEEQMKEFCNFKIDPKIKNRIEKIIIFISNDSPHRIKSANLYAKELEAKLIKLKNRGHFCISDNPINKEFPELLEEILKEEYFTDKETSTSPISLNGLTTKEAKEKIIKWLEENKVGKRTINYKLRDWCISRQRYWGPPVPIIYCKKCAKNEKENILILHGWEGSSKTEFIPSLKENLISKNYSAFAFDAPNTNEPDFDIWYKFIESKIKKNNLSKNFNLVGHSMGGLLALKLAEKYKFNKLILVSPVGSKPSKKYFKQFENKLTEEEIKIFVNYQNRNLDIKKIKENTQEIIFVFGKKDSWITEEIRNFYIKNFKDTAKINILENEGHMSEDEGVKKVKFIEDLFKKQTHGVYSVPEKKLPVKLPTLEKGWEPAGDGRGPLAKVESFMKTKCPKCGSPAEREPDVMDNFLDSAWYFFRYVSPNDSKNIFDKKLGKKWLPVDLYVGGNEHAVLHLMYTRFITMVLHDLGLIDFDNPFKKFRANGMILKDGKKMSKSKGNVVNPEEYGEKIGYDALKTYLLFLGPLSEDRSFSDAGAQGAKRWVERIFRLKEKVEDNYKDSKNTIKKFHQTIKAVTDDFEGQKYNTAIARLMEFTNALSAEKNISSQIWKKFLILAAPFVPALAEELWQKFGNEKSVFGAKWPKYNFELIKDETINLAIQVNGKFRGTIETGADVSEDEAKKIALENEKIKKWIKNKKIIKTIFIKGRLINFIIQ